MPKFSVDSLTRLESCHPDLRRLAMKVVEIMDCQVTAGYRDEEEQNKAFAEGYSQVKYPESKHNRLPSRAVDLVPYPVDWKNLKRFYLLAGLVLGVAHSMGLQLRWGGDWDRDYDLDDQKFNDLPHFELMEGNKYGNT